MREARGRDRTPRQLPSGKFLGCRHLVDGKIVGFDPRKAHKLRDPAQGFVAHYH
jgi:hypothetical protein